MYKVIKYSHDYKAGWDDYCLKNTNCTLYHTMNWLDFICHFFKCTNESLICLERNEIIGIFPLLCKKKVYISTPLRDRGGIVADTFKAGQLLFNELIKISGSNKFNIKLINDEELKYYSQNWLRNAGKTRSLLSLDKNQTEIWKGFKSAARNQFRKAEKNGLQFSQLNFTEYYKDFEQLFLSTRKKLGTLSYPKNYFKLMYDYMGNDHFKVFGAFKDNSLIGMDILLTFNDKVIYAYAAYNLEYIKYNINDFMIWNLIKWSMENNFKIFDFSADSNKNKGLIKFKSKWSDIQMPSYEIANVPEKKTNKSLEQFREFVLTKTPKVILQKLSDIIVPKLFF